MTSAPPFPPETTHQDEPPFWRDLLETTLSYMKWGYGALLLSFLVYGLNVARFWLLSTLTPTQWSNLALAAIVLLLCVLTLQYLTFQYSARLGLPSFNRNVEVNWLEVRDQFAKVFSSAREAGIEPRLHLVYTPKMTSVMRWPLRKEQVITLEMTFMLGNAPMVTKSEVTLKVSRQIANEAELVSYLLGLRKIEMVDLSTQSM